MVGHGKTFVEVWHPLTETDGGHVSLFNSCLHSSVQQLCFPSVRNLVKGMLELYQPTSPKWDSVAGLLKTIGWTKMANSTTAESFKEQGVSDQYIFEVIQAATRVNYGQNTDEIHAVGGAVSMAADGAKGIAGGNYQIFEQFLNHSGANVYLNTRVSKFSYSIFSC